MLSQLGSITLPSELVEKVHYGSELTDEEQKMAARVPAVTEQLLGNIPRLEAVREMLASVGKPPRVIEDPKRALVERGGQMIFTALDFDSLEAAATPRQGARHDAGPQRPLRCPGAGGAGRAARRGAP